MQFRIISFRESIEPIGLELPLDEINKVLDEGCIIARKLIELLKRNDVLKRLFELDARVTERYTVEEHTEMVINQFLSYLAAGMSHEKAKFFIKLLAVHDIGKGLSKGKQHRHTMEIVDSLPEGYFSKEEKRLAKAIIFGDPIGEALKTGSIDDSVKKIVEMSGEAGLNPLEFLNDYLIIYYQSDSSSYTSDAFYTVEGISYYGENTLGHIYVTSRNGFIKKGSRLLFSRSYEETYLLIYERLSLLYGSTSTAGADEIELSEPYRGASGNVIDIRTAISGNSEKQLRLVKLFGELKRVCLMSTSKSMRYLSTIEGMLDILDEQKLRELIEEIGGIKNGKKVINILKGFIYENSPSIRRVFRELMRIPGEYKHYTTANGLRRIIDTGVIEPFNPYRRRITQVPRIYFTPLDLSPREAEQKIFLGNPVYRGRADYVIGFSLLEPGLRSRIRMKDGPHDLYIEEVDLAFGRNIGLEYQGRNLMQ